MKKLILATLLIGMMGGCTEPTIPRMQTKIVTELSANPLTILIMEGCEYLQFSKGRKYSLCHKGNCSNPIHKEGNK
jgi:hypothetical protein